MLMGSEKHIRKVEAMFPDDVKTFIDESPEGTYTLLDVRQPEEYEEGHLPGAILISLPELGDSLRRLDAARPTIVYCAVGGRSRAAAQFLAHRGFERVYSVTGGINAWTEPTAASPMDYHLRFVRGDETPEEIIQQCYGMEEGLKRFHQAAMSKTADDELFALMGSLVEAEERHERALIGLMPGEGTGFRAASGTAAPFMEGGFDTENFLKENERYLDSVTGYLELAMMIETHALDLYLRMADVIANEQAREVLLRIADEEKGHLAALGRLMGKEASEASGASEYS